MATGTSFRTGSGNSKEGKKEGGGESKVYDGNSYTRQSVLKNGERVLGSKKREQSGAKDKLKRR